MHRVLLPTVWITNSLIAILGPTKWKLRLVLPPTNWSCHLPLMSIQSFMCPYLRKSQVWLTLSLLLFHLKYPSCRFQKLLWIAGCPQDQTVFIASCWLNGMGYHRNWQHGKMKMTCFFGFLMSRLGDKPLLKGGGDVTDVGASQTQKDGPREKHNRKPNNKTSGPEWTKWAQAQLRWCIAVKCSCNRI